MNLLTQIEIDPSIESKMELKDLDGKSFNVPNEDKIFFSLLGTSSKAWDNAVEKYPSGSEDRNIKVIASIVTGWTNVSINEDVALECNYENAIGFFKRYPEALSQCDNHIAKKSNYLKK